MLLRNLETAVEASMARRAIINMQSRTHNYVVLQNIHLGDYHIRPDYEASQHLNIITETDPPVTEQEGINWEDGDWIGGICDGYSMRPEPGRVGGTDGYVHVSSLINMCVRQHSLARVYDVTLQTAPPMRVMRLLWELGKASEGFVRQALVDRLGANNIASSLRLHDEEFMITGEADLAVRMQVEDGGRYFKMIEVKSLTREAFEEIEQPEANHALQVAMYQQMAQRVGPTASEPWSTWGNPSVVYVAREWVHGSPFREFPVDMSDPWVSGEVASMYEMAAELRDAAQRGGVAERHLCDTSEARLAGECPVADLCFNIGREAT